MSLDKPNNIYGKKAAPFAMLSAGLYDYDRVKTLPWDQYRDFALQLFQCRDDPHKLGGVQLDGFRGTSHVLAFDFKNHDVLDEKFIDDLHEAIGKKLDKQFFVIAPAGAVSFLQDHIEKDGIWYYVLRIPYSIINELHSRPFSEIKQPVSLANVNDTVDAVGFDFIEIPEISAEYLLRKITQRALTGSNQECVIRLNKFESRIKNKRPTDYKNLETLSMILVDFDYNGDYFNLGQAFFADQLNPEHEISFSKDKIGKKLMVIYIDIFGNEKKEVIEASKFR